MALDEHLPAFLAATELSDIDPEQPPYVGGIFSTVTPSNLDKALEILAASFGRSNIYFGVESLSEVDEIVDLLDAGAAKVFVSSQQLAQLPPDLDPGRIVVHPTVSPGEAEDQIEGTGYGLYLRGVGDAGAVGAILKAMGKSRPPIYVSKRNPVEDEVVELRRQNAVPIIDSAALSLDDEVDESQIRVASLVLAQVKSDRPDGLFPTLVTDERGIALGMVYSNEISVAESIRSGRGVYWSRKRGLWRKGDQSGDWQKLIHVEVDCDHDTLRFVVRQQGLGFCHFQTATCFGDHTGLSKLEKTLQDRLKSAPEGSYTARLFHDKNLLNAKIMEEASELCEATEKEHIAAEAADVFYFALTKAAAAGVSLADIERNLDGKASKVKRRKGDAKGPFAAQFGVSKEPESDQIKMRRIVVSEEQPSNVKSTDQIMKIATSILQSIRQRGDEALLEYTHKFEKATSLTSPVLKAPFAPSLMKLSMETKQAIDTSYANIEKFHSAQIESRPLIVETMPGVTCTRFFRPIERVGLYIPGGTAVLPSTAMMLGVPAKVAGCSNIVLASPPRSDGSITPEIIYIAHKIGAESIVLAGGAQAIGALAYGTSSVSKVDKILGPGNQFVTAAKMLVSNDTSAAVSIDMPAGPSEVLVVADASANPAFVASDLLSQAEHGPDSQVICITIGLTESQVDAINTEVHNQATALPRVDIVKKSIAHSMILSVDTLQQAMDLSNAYAPEHLILQISDPHAARDLVVNAGSVFCGHWTPESVGDYSAGVNHSLPTYGFAKQYSGVNLASFGKHITSSECTEEGLRNLAPAVTTLAGVEELEAHKRAVEIRVGR
ncbi:histidine biosynthesis trifunctional protein [Piedraia hortae CBS 480.64]|uniref:Histidine biosynthesis trifunctional protein n=1 Tax=Piedraia hortae CBS 480.64 TaxID=1314780 RepID=A0A6A7C5N2_9PEZI|nr:histidine biosynthesis trifunctional protein [Piedraia hortae CBS 480.64]